MLSSAVPTLESIALRAGRPALMLAPMEGVTDAPMRALMTERGGFTHCVSEFLRVSQNIPPARQFREHVPELARSGWRTPSGTPILLQLLGGDPGRLAETAALGASLGAPAIDLNFGCPAPTVNRHDGGATLLKHPARIRAIVAAVRAAVPRHVPVSAKLRLGWDNTDAIDLNAEMAALGGASWITIHARTRMQGYAPPVDWRAIGRVRARMTIPVVANGDIWSLDDFKLCRELTECEHFMLGRGALGDPELPRAAARELGLEPATPAGAADPARADSFPLAGPAWIPLLSRFDELCRVESTQTDYALRRFKQWSGFVKVKRLPPWYDTVKRCSTLEAAYAALAANGPTPSLA